eukprot:13175351-Ditylum_brightwellii.AAC.1
MGESCLPWKFINVWHPQAHLVGRPLTTIQHTYLHALKFIKVILEDDDQVKLIDWMPSILEDPIDWGKRMLELTPNIVGYIPPPTL